MAARQGAARRTHQTVTTDTQRQTLSDLVSAYFAASRIQDREFASQELSRFVRWTGPARSIKDLRPHELEEYASGIGQAGAAKSLEPLKTFFQYLKKQGHTSDNLGVHLRPLKTPRQGAGRQKKAQQAAPVHLTAGGMSRIQQELAGLHEEKLHLTQEIQRAAADKDFRENAPYHAAREKMGHTQGRIQELEQTLRLASIIPGDAPGDGPSRVRIGRTVIIADLSSSEELRYTIVSPKEVNLMEGKISLASPTGKALLDRSPGDTVTVEAPAGTWRYRVLRIES